MDACGALFVQRHGKERETADRAQAVPGVLGEPRLAMARGQAPGTIGSVEPLDGSHGARTAVGRAVRTAVPGAGGIARLGRGVLGHEPDEPAGLTPRELLGRAQKTAPDPLRGLVRGHVHHDLRHVRVRDQGHPHLGAPHETVVEVRAQDVHALVGVVQVPEDVVGAVAELTGAPHVSPGGLHEHGHAPQDPLRLVVEGVGDAQQLDAYR